MARRTESERLEAANEGVALGHFEEALRGLGDPRRGQGRRYPLRTVIVTALMSMVCGCDDAESMEVWGDANEQWLSTFLEMPHGNPTQDVFLSVFGALSPERFSKVYQAWAELISLRLGPEGKHLALDGKTSRRSGDASTDKPAIHTVSAWLCGAGLVLAQCQTGVKSNEIVAIPELLRILDLRGATVTIDAMGCQTAIAAAIVEGGGDYLLATKDNQPTLHAALKETFREADEPRRRTVDETPRPRVEVHEATQKGHGRIECRRVRVSDSLEWIQSADRWSNLGYVVEVTRQRTVLSSGRTSTEVAHYIGSGAPPPAARVATLVRGHWGIENELHWVLDMAFHEDEARHRARNTAANFTTLRHFALSLVKQDATRKLGVANSRKRAGFDRRYLISLLHGRSA